MKTIGKYYFKGYISGGSFLGIKSALNDVIWQLDLTKDQWEEEKGFLSIKIRFIVSSDSEKAIARVIPALKG